MTKELKGIEYLRKDFISSVSHEFKTPIASIQGFAKLLQNNDLTEEERQEYTQIIIEETTRMSKLSSNILNLSRLENQGMIENKTIFSLDEQIRKSILLLELEWCEKNIDFDIELDPVQFIGDEELLQQVWINLLSNAIKFSNENGKIVVRLYQVESMVKVKIIDTGIGMDEEVQKRIFEKFYKADTAHSFEGNGLGLSLVKRIIDLCNGKIYLKSNPGKGTTFTVELPLEKENM
jgi:signal transduction histidine kinase